MRVKPQDPYAYAHAHVTLAHMAICLVTYAPQGGDSLLLAFRLASVPLNWPVYL